MADAPNAKLPRDRFEAPGEPPSPPPTRWSGVAVVLLLLLGLALAWMHTGWALAPLALASALALARRRPPPGPTAPRRALVLDGRELLFDDAEGGALAPVGRLGERFGVTLLSNRARTRAALALTSPEATFYAGATLRDDEQPRCRALLEAAFTVASDERALEPAAPDGLPLLLGGEALARLCERLLSIDPTCMSRVLLTDARGDLVSFEPRRITAGPHHFDLDSRVDWRGLLFQETGPHGVTIYQATHLRQGTSEVLFVSLMPALSSPADPGDWASSDELLDQVTRRDLQLLQDTPADEPPSCPRVAIERVFMLPLRAALHGSRGAVRGPMHKPTSHPS